MAQERVLVVDDDSSVLQLLTLKLQTMHFEVLSATNGREALKLAYNMKPDLVVLDIMMPEMDGWETCRLLREMSDVPIVMLTALSDDTQVMAGFELGVDDFVRKPFNLNEVGARVQAVLRRVKRRDAQPVDGYSDDVLAIDLDRQQVWRQGDLVRLTPTEFRLLSYLVRRKGYVVEHEELLTEVWGPAYADATSCLSLYIRYLREKLEENPGEPKYVLTKWGVGYWFAPEGSVHRKEGVRPRRDS